MVFFQAADALELAMSIETNGEAFYRAAMQKTEVAEIKALFEDLAAQEVKHRAVFRKLSEAFKGKLLMSAADWDQYLEYLQATVQSALFESPERALAAAEEAADEKEAVRLAMGFEKETLLFFYNLRDLVTEREQKTIDRISAEEQAHVKRLAAML